MSFFAEINLLAGLPKFAAVADLNIGFQVNLTMEKKKDEEPKRELRSVRAPAGQEEDSDAGDEGAADKPMKPAGKKPAASVQQQDDE
jgi:hypothetical protein